MVEVTVTQEDIDCAISVINDADCLSEAAAHVKHNRTTALAAKEAENAELRAKVEKLREALAEQVGECFDERCEMCLRHEALLAETQPERTQP